MSVESGAASASSCSATAGKCHGWGRPKVATTVTVVVASRRAAYKAPAHAVFLFLPRILVCVCDDRALLSDRQAARRRPLPWGDRGKSLLSPSSRNCERGRARPGQRWPESPLGHSVPRSIPFSLYFDSFSVLGVSYPTRCRYCYFADSLVFFLSGVPA